MRLGTKSILFGAHAFWLHPFFVALGWLKLYGTKRVVVGSEWVKYPMYVPGSMVTWEGERQVTRFTSIFDPRLWFTFFVHDIGYIGADDMDGPTGKAHPYVGARWVTAWFGKTWGDFTLRHSRSVARWHNQAPSALCHADKLAFNLTPRWLYLAMTRATGELWEYMARAGYKSHDIHAQHYWHSVVCDNLLVFADRTEYRSSPRPRGN